MNTLTDKLAAALRAGLTPTDNIADMKRIHAKCMAVLAEYDALRAGPKEVSVPRQPSAPDVLVLGAAKAMSYGPRVEPYDDGIVVPAKSAEDAEFWAVYEWRTSKNALEGGWWEWIADCDTEDVARRIAEALARGA